MSDRLSQRTRWDPDALARLEDERDHLLASLEDLDREYAAGDLDEADYAELRDGYTVRTAQVVRAIEAGLATAPAPRTRRWSRIVLGLVAVIGLAVAAGVVVARSSGQRFPGQEITGGIPGDVAALLAEARLLLGVDPLRAQALYTEVLAERPEHPEALAYSGWLLALNSLDAEEDLRTLALDTAQRTLERAIAADPTYADPQCFLAIITANFTDEPERARQYVDRCLELDPPADMVALVGELVPD